MKILIQSERMTMNHVGVERHRHRHRHHRHHHHLTNDYFNVIMQSFEVDPDTAIWNIYKGNFNSIRTHDYESC